MMRHGSRGWLAAVALTLVLVTCFGCAQLGKYSVGKFPTKDTRAFQEVEVAKVEVGMTKSEVDAETPIELRLTIADAIRKAKIYEKVSTELEHDGQVLIVEPKIVEIDNGSRFLRWLIGMGAGKAYMEVSCRFIDGGTEEVIATGIFTGEIKGGFPFGASADQKKLSEFVAAAVARFLKKGK